MSIPLDYSQPPQALLLELINFDNGTFLTPAMVSLSDPIPVIHGARNTKVTLVSKPQSPYSGSHDVFYNRIDLAAIGVLEFLTESPVDSDSLLAAINAKTNAHLYLSDLDGLEITPTMVLGEVRKFNLSAKPTSIRWIGESSAEVCFGLPENIGDLDVLFNVTLPQPGYL